MKVFIIYLAVCSITQAVYINRMSPVNRMSTVNRMRGPTAFRPGVNLQLQRPWPYGPMRLAQAASHRAPYVLYRSTPQRYAIKHYGPSATRNIFGSPWKTTARLPPMSPVTPEYEFVKAASAQAVVHSDGGTGAIHTVPAPNLSLSEKPIVVIEASENPVSEQSKPSYEVTEKYPDSEFSVGKIGSPSFTGPELQTLIRNGAALQLASEYSLPAMSVNHQIVPQQFQMQGLNNLPSHQDLLNTGAEGIFISPNALYQSDPMFLQKLQNQLMQRFPAVEFIPYAANVPNQIQIQQQQASQQHPQIVLLENEQLPKPIPIHIPQHPVEQKNVIQRETPEASVVTLIPQSFVVPNTTEKQLEVTTPQSHNITIELASSESQPVTTTVKYVIEAKKEEQNTQTTPIYYAQVGQSVGSVIANGFYSAINDVRAAAAMAQENKIPETTPEKPVDVTTSTTTLIPDLKPYFVKSDEKSENTTTTELKALLGVPFTKVTDSVNVAYTLVRADEKQPNPKQEGAVYAGQIVEATVSEDQDFNKEKANIISKRAPIRLLAVADSKNIASAAQAANTVSIPRVTVVKAKIPAKSKLTFDEKTGEPILRIYASYVDNPAQKDAVVAKLASLKPSKEPVTKKDLVETWKGATVKSVEKNQGLDANQVTQFGLKLRQRSDDYIPLFEEYDD